MREFQAHKKEKVLFHRFLNSRWTLIVILILMIFLIKGNIRIFKNYFYVKEKYDQDIKNYNDLKNREIQLNKDIQRLQTEQGLDYEIRKKLDVSKDDEKIIKIIDKN